jgi:hypothetical protein
MNDSNQVTKNGEWPHTHAPSQGKKKSHVFVLFFKKKKEGEYNNNKKNSFLKRKKDDGRMPPSEPFPRQPKNMAAACLSW